MHQIETLANEFVQGYVAGSCNSYDTSLEAFGDVVKDHDLAFESELEVVFDNAIERAGIFHCDCCGWWCWDHEFSTSSVGNCSECYPDEEEEDE